VVGVPSEAVPVLVAKRESVKVADADDDDVLEEARNCDADVERENGTSAMVAMRSDEVDVDVDVDIDIDTDEEMLLRESSEDDGSNDAVPIGR
jgi:hypothetical protein